MGTTVQLRREPRSSANESRVARRAAKLLGLTPGSAQQYLQHAPQKTAMLIRACMEEGKPEVAERIFARMEVEMCATRAPESEAELADLIRRTQEADMQEDIAEARWMQTRSDSDRRKLVSAMDVYAAMHRQLRNALDAMGRT